MLNRMISVTNNL